VSWRLPFARWCRADRHGASDGCQVNGERTLGMASRTVNPASWAAAKLESLDWSIAALTASPYRVIAGLPRLR
jgi:hypothetical protein